MTPPMTSGLITTDDPVSAVSPAERSALMGQRPAVLWFTGLSGAGKSSLAVEVERRLHRAGHHTYLLDGDAVRAGICKDLGFTDADRAENIRRAAEIAKLMVDAGLIVLAAFISPFRAEREAARSLFAAGAFLEIHMDAPLAVLEARDVKGLYRRARRGEIKQFTGIDSPYEAPENPELRIDSSRLSIEQAVDIVMAKLQAAGIVELAPATRG
jgi:bifunctional enzyme CysN/CysC